ncbi:hypothetical protein ACTFIZ_002306 [Dictyostelium cf. discoideum]
MKVEPTTQSTTILLDRLKNNSHHWENLNTATPYIMDIIKNGAKAEFISNLPHPNHRYHVQKIHEEDSPLIDTEVQNLFSKQVIMEASNIQTSTGFLSSIFTVSKKGTTERH